MGIDAHNHGGLVFSGGTNNRKLHAFDAQSSRLILGRLNAITGGKYPDVPEGGAIWVFAVP